MQLVDLPLTIEMYYYIKGLKVEICKIIESNELNLTDMAILKNTCLWQDHIMSPLSRNDKKVSKSNEDSIAFMASSTRGRHNYQGRYTHRGIPNR